MNIGRRAGLLAALIFVLPVSPAQAGVGLGSFRDAISQTIQQVIDKVKERSDRVSTNREEAPPPRGARTRTSSSVRGSTSSR